MTKFGVLVGSGLAAAALVLTAASASAAEFKLYGLGEVGMTFADDLDGSLFDGTGLGAGDIDDTFLVGLGAGVEVTFPGTPWLGLRTDLTVSMRNGYEINGSDSFGGSTMTADAEIDSVAALVNLYAEFNVGGGFKPFIGGGVGFARNDLGEITYAFDGFPLSVEQGGNSTEFAYQLSAGLTYDFGGAAIDLGYRYFDAGSVETSGNTTLGPVAPVSQDLIANEIFTSIRIWF
jgi:opacity protein-like surface antigen